MTSENEKAPIIPDSFERKRIASISLFIVNACSNIDSTSLEPVELPNGVLKFETWTGGNEADADIVIEKKDRKHLPHLEIMQCAERMFLEGKDIKAIIKSKDGISAVRFFAYSEKDSPEDIVGNSREKTSGLY